MKIIPDITRVDFNDADDIRGFASLLLATAAHLGMPGGHTAFPREASALAGTAKEWVSETNLRLSALSAGDALSVADCIGLVHPLAYGRPADEGPLNHHRLNAFEAYIGGDSSVDKYLLHRAVSRQVRLRDRQFLTRPLQWECTCTARWHSRFRHGRSSVRLSTLDTAECVASLLRSDLWAFETRNESAFKRRLFDLHRRHLPLPSPAQQSPSPKPTESPLTSLDLKTLSALDRLLSASAPYLSPLLFNAAEASILRAILPLPETNLHLKAAIKLRLQDIPTP